MKIDRIIERMDKDNLNTLILLKPENIAYLTGFYPSSIAILILKDDPVLLLKNGYGGSSTKVQYICGRIQIPG